MSAERSQRHPKLLSFNKLIDQFIERYQQDFKYFYSDYSIDMLLDGVHLKQLPPMQRGALRPNGANRKLAVRKKNAMNSNQKLKKLIRKGIRGKHAEAVTAIATVHPTSSSLAPRNRQHDTNNNPPTTSRRLHQQTMEPKFFGRYYEKDGIGTPQIHERENYQLRGEGSTMYSSQLKSFRHTPELMHRYIPDAKLIYIVRHPLDRIVSQWRHYRAAIQTALTSVNYE